jgi:hypothetical protein
MEYTIANAATQRPALVAPTFGEALGGLRPKTGSRRVDAHTQVASQAVGDAGMPMGHRPWSQLIT